MEKSKRFAAPEAAIRLWFWLFAAAALIAAVCMPDRGQMFAGLGRLCVLPYQSANSYFDAANGGFAGTFLNVALVCAICAAVYSLPGSKPDGVSVLAFFLTAGFAFWGITVLNIWFCFAGTLIVCTKEKTAEFFRFASRHKAGRYCRKAFVHSCHCCYSCRLLPGIRGCRRHYCQCT